MKATNDARTEPEPAAKTIENRDSAKIRPSRTALQRNAAGPPGEHEPASRHGFRPYAPFNRFRQRHHR